MLKRHCLYRILIFKLLENMWFSSNRLKLNIHHSDNAQHHANAVNTLHQESLAKLDLPNLPQKSSSRTIGITYSFTYITLNNVFEN